MAVIDKTLASKACDAIIHVLLILLALLCLFPMVNVLALSFSDPAEAYRVTVWPRGFHIKAYMRVLSDGMFYTAFAISLKRLVAGVVINMGITILSAYPLSLSSVQFKGRQFFAWYFVVTMLFGGGLVPSFMINKSLGLYDNFWVLVLPGAVHVYEILILQNAFKRLPASVTEAARIDGAGHFSILFRIFLPMCMATLATLTLFCAVAHWNEWFGGMLYMNSPQKWPLQTYLSNQLESIDLQTMDPELAMLLEHLSDRNLKAANIFLTTLPILFAYPFLQRYFVKGIVIGSVKE